MAKLKGIDDAINMYVEARKNLKEMINFISYDYKIEITLEEIAQKLTEKTGINWRVAKVYTHGDGGRFGTAYASACVFVSENSPYYNEENLPLDAAWYNFTDCFSLVAERVGNKEPKHSPDELCYNLFKLYVFMRTHYEEAKNCYEMEGGRSLDIADDSVVYNSRRAPVECAFNKTVLECFEEILEEKIAKRNAGVSV